MKLRCPICQTELHQDHGLTCQNHHHFDYAKSKYIHLARKQKQSGDDALMVHARTAFFATENYAFLKKELKKIIAQYTPSSFVDLGCGEGYYTKEITANDKVGIDLSKVAIQHAAKHDPTTQYIVASIFDCPLFDQSVDLILACFVPLPESEIRRLLKPNGHLITVSPDIDHLFEMKQILYATPYYNQIKSFPFNLEKEIHLSKCMHLDTNALTNLFYMTPYAYKTGKQGLEKLKNTDYLDVKASFVIRIYSL